jgi:catalase (peroxidase I)
MLIDEQDIASLKAKVRVQGYRFSQLVSVGSAHYLPQFRQAGGANGHEFARSAERLGSEQPRQLATVLKP